MGERDDWLARVERIKRNTRRGYRAPHKPLLLLYALGRLTRNDLSPLRYVDVESDLEALLVDWGPPNRTKASYPFFHLKNDDGLWAIRGADGEVPGDARSQLVRADAIGQLDPVFVEVLLRDPGLVVLIGRYLLDENWPASLHQEITSAVGLDLEDIEVDLVRGRLATDARRRDPTFRRRVLLAYEYRCAICGYDGRIDAASVGLDAAHIRWFSAEGPDVVANALCLCSFHHVLLDKGVLGLTPEHTVRVSKHFIGHSDAARHLVLRHQGAPILEPQAGEEPVAADHVGWHDRQVFRSPARVGG